MWKYRNRIEEKDGLEENFFRFFYGRISLKRKEGLLKFLKASY